MAKYQLTRKHSFIASLVLLFLLFSLLHLFQTPASSPVPVEEQHHRRQAKIIFTNFTIEKNADLKTKVAAVDALPAEPPKEVVLSANCPVFADVKGNLGPADVLTKRIEAVTTDSMTAEEVAKVVEEHWLTARWQAASNMKGDPIPGVHWLVLDLQSSGCSNSDAKELQQEDTSVSTLVPPPRITKILLDWEDAHSKDFVVQGCNFPSGAGTAALGLADAGGDVCSAACGAEDWKLLASSLAFTELPRTKRHIRHQLLIGGSGQAWQYGATTSGQLGSGMEFPAYRCVRIVINRPATRWGSSLWQVEVSGYREGA